VGSEEGCLNLGAMVCGIGENKASAEAESKAGGFEGVAARRDVVHKIGLAERQYHACAGKVVLVGRDGAKRQLVAGTLGLDGLGPVAGFDNLSAGAVVGDVMGKVGVGVGIAGAVGDRDQPAGAGNEGGHFAGGGVEVQGMAGGGFDGVGKAAGGRDTAPRPGQPASCGANRPPAETVQSLPVRPAQYPFRHSERGRASVKASAAEKESRGLALWRGAGPA